MKRQNSLILACAGIVLLAGCSTTVNLYEYKDVSSVNIVDESKASYHVQKPTLSANILVDEENAKGYGKAVRHLFLSSNDEKSIFNINETNAYTLKLTLSNLESFKKFVPASYVETKKGGYYTDPYWSYSVSSAINAELVSPKGEQRFFKSSDRLNYSSTGIYPQSVPREKYLMSLQNSTQELFLDIANSVTPEGLIISKKVSVKNSNDAIFMVNMGLNHGLQPEQRVNIYKEVIQKNEIDAQTLSNKIKIGTATVSNQANVQHAWIVMDDERSNTIVEVGDIVQARY